MRHAGIWMAALAIASGSAQAQTSPANSGVNRLAADWMSRVRSLNLPVLPGATPAWYVPGGKDRARRLQRLLADEAQFFRHSLGVDVKLGVAVLDPEHWPKVKDYGPFGMPSVSSAPHLAVMPDDWNKVVWFPFPSASQSDPGLVAEASAARLDWDRALRDGADLIVTHEFGHTLIAAARIDARSAWFNEFLATYAGYAFVQARRPKLVLPNRLFNLIAGNAPHPHTSLRYLDANLGEIAAKTPANYAWYQGQIFARVEQVYAAEGVGFLKEVQLAFAPGAPMDHDAVLDRLERLSPGWKAWAAGLAALER